jgi:uncharacterized protein
MEIKRESLSDAELDELEELLSQIGGRAAMNVEELDGFQCALICGPELVGTAEYLPEILGVKLEDAKVSPKEETLRRLLQLLAQNWNSIVGELQSERSHCPLLLLDEKGMVRGNDWANSFMRGMEMRREAWAEAMQDDQECAPLIPILALAYENDPDPTLRPYKKPVGNKLREKLIAGVAAGLQAVFERRLWLEQPAKDRGRDKSSRQKAAGIGRNDPCYCGSGKKYKKCCGALRPN